MVPRLPLEVVETIIDDVAEFVDDNDYDNIDNVYHSSIKACALVCHSFLPLCRKHIFSSVTLNAREARRPSSPTSHDLNHLLSNSPHLAVYIRKLNYHISRDEFYKRRSLWLLPMFKRLVRLKKLVIKHSPSPGRERLNWMSSPERMVLLPLLRLPNLTRICLKRIRNFPLADLAGCVNLKELKIQYLGCSYGVGNFLEALPTTPAMLERLVINKGSVEPVQQLCVARRPDGKPIIDFSSLKIITVQVATCSLQSMRELFGMCRNLQKIDLLGMSFSHYLFIHLKLLS